MLGFDDWFIKIYSLARIQMAKNPGEIDTYPFTSSRSRKKEGGGGLAAPPRLSIADLNLRAVHPIVVLIKDIGKIESVRSFSGRILAAFPVISGTIEVHINE